MAESQHASPQEQDRGGAGRSQDAEAPIFWRPADGFVGDVIPYFSDGAFHAFYLKAPMSPFRYRAEGTRTPWAHVVSKDLVHWEEWQTAIEPGGPSDPDYHGCWTGSVIEAEGLYHLFYTGGALPGEPQTICHATSADLRSWTKDLRNPIMRADPRWYESADWRDPFVFWNDEAGEYWMLVAARANTGPVNRRGCVGLAVSSDLDSWHIKEPFWSPNLYSIPLECPDLFRLGDEWALVFSQSTDGSSTHYRLARSLAGPWLASQVDSFDGAAYYAAKTASDGLRRFSFGWTPTREGEGDDGRWEWGGALVVHQLSRHDGGNRIAIGPPAALSGIFKETINPSLKPILGAWSETQGTYRGMRADGFGACLVGKLPEQCQIDVTARTSGPTTSCGLLLRADEGLETYYRLRWEPIQHRIVFDEWPIRGRDFWPRPADKPFALERSIGADRLDNIKIRLVIDGSVMVAYVDDVVALTCRAYDHKEGHLGLFVSDGEATFADLAIRRH